MEYAHSPPYAFEGEEDKHFVPDAAPVPSGRWAGGLPR